MSSQETRDRLISIIKDHQLEHGQTKISVSELCLLAKISRQAFNRYYGDLKDYSSGKMPIARLFVDDNASLTELIENKDERILKLENELSTKISAHKQELDAVVKNHLSTLMNNDILAFEASQLTATLTNQGNHNAYLNKLVTELEVKNAKLTMDFLAANTNAPLTTGKSDKNFICFDFNLDKANQAYADSKNFSDYEDRKEEKLAETIKQIKKLPNPEQIDIIFFQEKYISTFKSFGDRVHPAKQRLLIVIRLPIYSQEEIKLLMKALRPITSFSMYVPYSASEAIIASQRQFNFRDIPPEELRDADNAKLPSMNWGFDSIHINKIRQGD
ncbi:TetR/AcrR family transcriptional regulator [Pseudomonas argentinensis]|uniref:TetR/AcrR family transcriptional regulator n=1 Tax=Phytopseudomonas argentinensis TaxID=289370 RepID=UPI0008AA477C|nr:TetR/AcrR family transcriptional regulator [Pseudomonas argentinensis]